MFYLFSPPYFAHITWLCTKWEKYAFTNPAFELDEDVRCT